MVALKSNVLRCNQTEKERNDLAKRHVMTLRWKSLAGFADCSFIESLNDYKWSRSSLRYDLMDACKSCNIRAPCGHTNFELFCFCPSRERPAAVFTTVSKPIRNTKNLMQVEKTRFRFQEVLTSTGGDNEIPSTSFARAWEWFLMLFLRFVCPINESRGIKNEGNYL